MRSAKLAVDHSNLRACYGILRTAELTGSVDDGTSAITPDDSEDVTVYMQKDGTLSSTLTDFYKIQVTANAEECAESIACKEAAKALGSGKTTADIHKENYKIGVKHTKSTTTTPAKWTLVTELAS